jgi:hypothetical protein
MDPLPQPQSGVTLRFRRGARSPWTWVAVGLAVLLAAVLSQFPFSTHARAEVVPTPDPTAHTNGRVAAITKLGNVIYVGGTFTSVTTRGGTVVARPYLAAIDATTGDLVTGFSPNPNAQVRALANDGTKVFAAGDFTSIGGAARTKLAAVNASTGAADANFIAHPAGGGDTIYALMSSTLHVFVGGSFSQMADRGGPHSLPRFAMLSASTGNVTSWRPAVNNTVYAISFSSSRSRVFLGGKFTTAGGASHVGLASIVASTGAIDPNFKANSVYTVISLAVSPNRLYAGIGGSSGGRCAGFDATVGARAFWIITNGNVQATSYQNGILYCGGHFAGVGAFGGLQRAKQGAVNTTTGAVTDYAPTFDSPLGIFAQGFNGTKLLTGGDFTTVSGVSQQGYAQVPTS